MHRLIDNQGWKCQDLKMPYWNNNQQTRQEDSVKKWWSAQEGGWLYLEEEIKSKSLPYHVEACSFELTLTIIWAPVVVEPNIIDMLWIASSQNAWVPKAPSTGNLIKRNNLQMNFPWGFNTASVRKKGRNTWTQEQGVRIVAIKVTRKFSKY